MGERVLAWRDGVLRTADVDVLRTRTAWLGDSLISFALSLLEQRFENESLLVCDCAVRARESVLS